MQIRLVREHTTNQWLPLEPDFSHLVQQRLLPGTFVCRSSKNIPAAEASYLSQDGLNPLLSFSPSCANSCILYPDDGPKDNGKRKD